MIASVLVALSWAALVAPADIVVCPLANDRPLIVGGVEAGLGEYPWMALLGYKGEGEDCTTFKCGGSLINNRYVLTAGHCLLRDLHVVRLGEWQISKELDCNVTKCAPPVIDLNIERRIRYPDYLSNDIALLKLEHDIDPNPFVSSIKLPGFNEPAPAPGVRMTVAGWGTTEDGSRSDVLLKVEVPIFDSVDCQSRLPSMGNITENQICAGGEGGKDACTGDSGGPLMGNGPAGLYQEGIVSYGDGCGVIGVPGVYTRVAKYMDWITKNINN